MSLLEAVEINKGNKEIFLFRLRVSLCLCVRAPCVRSVVPTATAKSAVQISAGSCINTKIQYRKTAYAVFKVKAFNFSGSAFGIGALIANFIVKSVLFSSLGYISLTVVGYSSVVLGSF